MNVLATMEKLAATTHHSAESAELVASLPKPIRAAALAQDNHKLRQLLSGQHCFADARTVTALT